MKMAVYKQVYSGPKAWWRLTAWKGEPPCRELPCKTRKIDVGSVTLCKPTRTLVSLGPRPVYIKVSLWAD